jgi:hypothetical protein
LPHKQEQSASRQGKSHRQVWQLQWIFSYNLPLYSDVISLGLAASTNLFKNQHTMATRRKTV